MVNTDGARGVHSFLHSWPLICGAFFFIQLQRGRAYINASATFVQNVWKLIFAGRAGGGGTGTHRAF